jgi:hypothetical protein
MINVEKTARSAGQADEGHEAGHCTRNQGRLLWTDRDARVEGGGTGLFQWRE